MSTVRITKEFSFEMSHALPGYDGACSQIHGHSYRLFVTVKGSPQADTADPKYGMVMDFGMLKRIVNKSIVNRYDHALMIRATDGNADLIEALTRTMERVIVVDNQPTCENLVLDFAKTLSREFPANIALHSLRLHETATSFAEWFAEDNI